MAGLVPGDPTSPLTKEDAGPDQPTHAQEMQKAAGHCLAYQHRGGPAPGDLRRGVPGLTILRLPTAERMAR
jgi:hypothetical protein